jgi:hypothetical protein
METTINKIEKKELKPKKNSTTKTNNRGLQGFGFLKGKIHYDDSVWGFYGN